MRKMSTLWPFAKIVNACGILMRAPKTTYIPSVIVALLFFAPHPLQAETAYLFGKIGKFPIGASLERNKEKLSGWYFYHSRAREIRLEGTIDGKGSFHVRELAGNKQTGSIEGSMKQGRWTGTWRKTAGAAPLPFYLEENRTNLEEVRGNFNCTAEERDAEYHYAYRLKLKLVVTDGVVKEFDATQSTYGDDKDEQTCTITLADLKQVASDAGILLQAKDDCSEAGDTRCTVRIMGDTNLLWIRFGDSTEEGNDCRSLGSTMFCSPRAFWNDMIVNRRTRKCKAIR